MTTRTEYRIVNGVGITLRLLPDISRETVREIAAEYPPDVQARVEARVVQVGDWAPLADNPEGNA